MNTVIADEELEKVARRCVWWIGPDKALRDPPNFLCHVMVYGLWRDAMIIRRRFSHDQLRDALTRAPAGLFDVRSWHYWHHLLGQPVPPLPLRQIPKLPQGAASSKADFHMRGG